VRLVLAASVLFFLLAFASGSSAVDNPVHPEATVATLPQPVRDIELAALRQQVKLEHQRYLNARRHVRRLQQAVRASPPRMQGPLVRELLCIHSFEGSWRDPNPPFFGGLQMDYSFARAYGGEFLHAWGTPDNWPPFVQLTVAMRAILAGRGFGPWPNTARMCGLL
jgi:hypothetical protein